MKNLILPIDNKKIYGHQLFADIVDEAVKNKIISQSEVNSLSEYADRIFAGRDFSSKEQQEMLQAINAKVAKFDILQNFLKDRQWLEKTIVTLLEKEFGVIPDAFGKPPKIAGISYSVSIDLDKQIIFVNEDIDYKNWSYRLLNKDEVLKQICDDTELLQDADMYLVLSSI